MRAEKLNFAPTIIWMYGMSGAGKSTLASELDYFLNTSGFNSSVLDGDTVRQGLCKDLSFSKKDREENIRRVGELTKNMYLAGNIVIGTFITPFETTRETLREIFSGLNAYFVYVKCDLEECESRDPKGLYIKARKGEISNFTGIDSPFDEPENVDLVLNTTTATLKESFEDLKKFTLNKVEKDKG